MAHGPVLKTHVSNEREWKFSISSTQHFPRERKPLEYDMERRLIIHAGGLIPTLPPYVQDPRTRAGWSLDQALNLAYAKFKSRCMDNADLAVTVAERKQAADMIATRATQLWQFSRRLNRWDFAGAAKALGLKRDRKFERKMRAKMTRGAKEGVNSLSNVFLEYHFGWVPLIKDLGNALDVLQNPVNPKRVVGTASVQAPWYGSSYDGRPNSDVWYRLHGTYTVKCRIAAKIRVTNHDLLRANQLGFVNPASVAWELVPFSFVVDWFVPVGNFLASATDFLGLDLIEPETTTLEQVLSISEGYSSDFEGSSLSTALRRRLYIRTPTLVPQALKPFGISRAAAAVSLVVQQLFRISRK